MKGENQWQRIAKELVCYNSYDIASLIIWDHYLHQVADAVIEARKGYYATVTKASGFPAVLEKKSTANASSWPYGRERALSGNKLSCDWIAS